MSQALVDAWAKSWDAYLEVLGKSAEGTLTAPEFLRLQRRTLDLLCGHRDLWLKASAPVPARKRARRR